jgi:putative methyltransferase
MEMKSVYFLALNYIPFVPYAYGLLRAYAEQNGLIASNYEWKEPFWQMAPVETVVEKIVDPDILLCSCYVWNHNNHLKIAQMAKERYPDCKVVCGGPHVPDSSESYFSDHPFVDVLVHGEGEIPLENLLVEFLNEKPDLRKVQGISFNEDRRAIKTLPGDRLPKDLPIPSPYLMGFFDSFISENSDILGLWETNRGCPNSCSFCTWGVNSTNKITLHDFEKVSQEIEFIAKHKIKEVYVTDANFGVLKRDLEIAGLLAENKKKYGYPLGLRFNFAKTSNDTVYNISKLLYDNDMLWGTTLSMQSVASHVQVAISRPSLSLDKYRELKNRYKKHSIPTYTELLLGLPLETRDSFIDGICNLFEIGIHEDIRVFELALLPNAPLSHRAAREKYGIKSRFKPLHTDTGKGEREFVELVFETDTMPYEDWAYSLLFAEAIQALHNGGYTRFIAIYLNDNKILSYRDFYDNLLQFALKSDAECFKAFSGVRKLIDDFYEDSDIPQVHRLLSESESRKFLNSYSSNRKAWKLFTYIWLWLSEHIEDFYKNLLFYIEQRGVRLDEKILDLVRYQQDLMITLDYDPKVGKIVYYLFNWFEYFFENKGLRKASSTLHYTDTHMGTTNRYELKKNDKQKFLNAAIGYAYPYSKFRHFFHQPDGTRKLHAERRLGDGFG